MQRLLTSVVGSYPQPGWLVDAEALRKRLVPRVRVPELWRVPADLLDQAQDDATLLAIHDQESAGVDIVTDGEIRRESYSNRFATALGGVDPHKQAEIMSRGGRPAKVPLITGAIRRTHPIEVAALKFLRANTARSVKITVPGPFTLSQQARTTYYDDDEALAMAYAEAVNAEVHDLFAAGADIVQLDEPWLQSRVEQAQKFGVKAINRALQGAAGTTAVHLCFGYAAVVKTKPAEGYSFLPELEDTTADQISIEAAQPQLHLGVLANLPSKTIVLGVLDLNASQVESAELVAARIREALQVLPPQRLIVAPDCGMKYLPRALAYAKLQAMVAGTRIVNAEIAAG